MGCFWIESHQEGNGAYPAYEMTPCEAEPGRILVSGEFKEFHEYHNNFNLPLMRIFFTSGCDICNYKLLN
jgi:hypothetical protein